MRLPHSLTCALLAIAAWCAPPAYAADTMTGIFSPDFRTLQLSVNGQPMALPIINLDGSDHLTVAFDLLAEDHQYLRYTILHCNADWQPSPLVDSELFDGFNFGEVTNYDFSRGTTVHYVHYWIDLPNEEYQFRVSGNYLLRVYPENDPDKTLLQARFMVVDPRLRISGRSLNATDIDYRAAHQQLELVVDAAGYPVNDMFNDLRVVIEQNQRQDNRVTLSHPSRVQAGRAIYEHMPQLIFPAGNEYRRMETVSVTYPGMGVDHIEYRDPYYYHFLAPDATRFHLPYSYDQTQHGRFLPRLYGSADSDLEADYSVVVFTLDMGRNPDYDFYIEGDLTQRRLDDDSRLEYDPQANLYRRALLLKQGAYNYQYLALPRSPQAPSSHSMPVEGDFYQTTNEYTVLVYYRPPSGRYDQLLGATIIR